ncbi:hypothetical protein METBISCDRAFT_25205 [Metschnikowia bicuspidata]|uniref:J domain-containing protein n=1 Tax=Metschnikowia bicuspidata TaxID=27322 RepID=A0A4P9ZKC0_9ASCO|nr:hypothetical protein METBISCDRAFT_25205 [Metschnikowia bicuspidata]
MSADYYQVLGVSRAASAEDLKRLYKKLAVKFHPDKNKDASAHEKFLLISKAYETLKDAKLRQDYDRKNGFSARGAGGATLFAYTSFASPHYSQYSTSYRSENTPRAHSSYRSGASYFANYFGMNPRTYTHVFMRDAEAAQAKTNAQNIAEEAERMAADAKKMMQEHIARKKEEYLRNAQKQKEQEEMHRLEQVLRKFSSRYSSTDPLRRDRFGMRHNLWEADAEDVPSGSLTALQPGQNSSRPIVVEDVPEDAPDVPSGHSGHKGMEKTSDVDVDEAEDVDQLEDHDDLDRSVGGSSLHEDATNDQETQDSDDLEEFCGEKIDVDAGNHFFRADKATNPPSEGLNYADGNSFASDTNEYPKTPVSEPDIVEIDGAAYANTNTNTNTNSNSSAGTTGRASSYINSASSHDSRASGHNNFLPKTFAQHEGYPESIPNRKNGVRRAPSLNERPGESMNGAKKARLSNFDDMRSSLGTDLDDVDFSDIRETLPDSKARKASFTSRLSSSKRPKIVEYTDGNARALTLFTPVNQFKQRDPSHFLSVRDLQPKKDPAILNFTHRPPKIKLTSATAQHEWETYVAKTRVYQQLFAEHRKNVLDYQVQRLEIDQRSQNAIYSDEESLDVYQACLATEFQVMQGYNEAFQEFQQTLRIFRANCSIMNTKI